MSIAPRSLLILICGLVVLGCGPGETMPTSTPMSASASAKTPPPVAGGPKVSWSSAVNQGVLAGEYRIREAGGTFAAVNRAADLRARWSSAVGLSAWRAGGAAPEAKGSAVSLKAVGVGRTDAVRALGSRDFALGACRSDGVKDETGACLKRLERDLGGVQEWWENRGDGIAHGFVVDRAPAGQAGPRSWMQVKVRVSGARIALEADGRGAILASSNHRFRYTGLTAWDADRQTLPTRMRRAGTSLLLEVDDRGARYPVVIDPVLTLQTWGYQSNQASPGGDPPAGQDMVVAGAFDVNNDTHQDVLVSFPRYNSAAGNNSGIVYLFLGSATGPATTPAWSSEGTNAANTAAGPVGESLFGRSLAAGYINGDAFADLVVGQVAWGNGESLEGRVYVFFGQAGASPLPALANQVLEGRSANAFFGRAVALGNLDGVNGADLIVGSSGFNANSGRVELYLADAAGAFPADAAPSDTVLGATGSSLGESVVAGDVNNDGRADVHAVARTQSLDPNSNTTVTGVIYSLVTDVGGLVGAPFIWFPTVFFDSRLANVAFAGDVDGDGFGDLVSGAPTSTRLGTGGMVFLLYGSANGLNLMNYVPLGSIGTGPGPGFGASVAGPVDVDNDGYFDIVAGAPHWSFDPSRAGSVMVIRGSPTGPLVSHTGAIDTDSLAFGEGMGDLFGSTVAAVGDVNKDGFGDLLAGASGFDGAEVDEGKAYLILGGQPSALMQGKACTTNGQCASGFCVDGACCNTICGGTAGVEADNTTDCQACATGTCSLAAVGASCASTNLCLMASACDETGACIGGVPKSCAVSIPSGANPCRDTGVCDPATGLCPGAPKPDSTACDDGNACTTGTTCQAGVCTAGTVVTCAAPGICKLSGTCNTTTGTCEYANIPDGTSCNDGNMCTSGEVCLAGVCATTPALTCGAESACKNAGACDPGTGVCTQTNKADGTACDDGNMCTLTTTCAAGACGAGTARSCDDSNPCTADSCVAATGCVNAPMVGCVTDAGTDAIDATDATDAPDASDPADASDGADGAEVSQPSEVRPPDTMDARPADAGTGGTGGTGTGGSGGPGGTGGAGGISDASPGDARDGAPGDGIIPPTVKAGGSGCDCELGNSEGSAPVQLSALIGLALVLVRVRRRRRY
jgi:hypothetical protein